MSAFRVLSLRVTVPKKDPIFLLSCITPYTNKYAYGFEISKKGKPHYHVYMQVLPLIKDSTIRAHIRRKLQSLGMELKGNKYYSLKEVKTPAEQLKYLGYVIKELDYDTHNLDPLFLQKAKDYDAKVKKEIALKKLPRIARLSQSEDVVYACSRRDYKGLISLICEDFTSQNKAFLDHQIIGIYNSLMWLHVPGSRKETISRIYQKINF